MKFGVLIVCIMGLGASPAAFSSGYHPPFDRALDQAVLVVQGDVVESWNALGDERTGKFSRERAYRMVVGKCFKGKLKPGEEVFFWDPHYGSTASYWIRDNSRYICYLVPAKFSDFEAERIRPAGKRYYKPIRVRRKNTKTDRRASAKDYYTPELRLLDLFVENIPADKRSAYQQLLKIETEPQLLLYVVKDWPRPLTPTDADLFKAHIRDAPDASASYIRSMTHILSEEAVSLPDDFIVSQLSDGGPDFLPALRSRITTNNIEQIRPLLFKWVMELDAGGTFPQVIDTLAEYAPDWFKAQLASNALPEWKLIASLHALGINGSAIGKPDYPDEILSIYPSKLRTITSLREGDLFHARLALSAPSRYPDWKSALPLLEPLLAEADSPARRLCVALFRTFGIPVERKGDGYKAQYKKAPAPCPVKLSLSMDQTSFKAGETVRIRVTEKTAVSGGCFCFHGEPCMTLDFLDNWHSPQSVPEKIWENVSLPRDTYVVLKEDTVHDEELTVHRTIDRPGTYRITLGKCYPNDGAEHGLDAWTGMIFADNELTFTVEEP